MIFFIVIVVSVVGSLIYDGYRQVNNEIISEWNMALVQCNKYMDTVNMIWIPIVKVPNRTYIEIIGNADDTIARCCPWIVLVNNDTFYEYATGRIIYILPWADDKIKGYKSYGVGKIANTDSWKVGVYVATGEKVPGWYRWYLYRLNDLAIVKEKYPILAKYYYEYYIVVKDG